MKEQEQQFRQEFELPNSDTQDTLIRKVAGNIAMMRIIGGSTGTRDKPRSVKKEV